VTQPASSERVSVACDRCNAIIRLPAVLSAEQKARIARAVRSSPLGAVSAICREWPCDLDEAKTLAFHCTRSPGLCHRCGTPVAPDVSVCPNCRSVNLDWDSAGEMEPG
jgi:RNA polymerase subunit RPABC4/transcription elongation factor Spt4